MDCCCSGCWANAAICCISWNKASECGAPILATSDPSIGETADLLSAAKPGLLSFCGVISSTDGEVLFRLVTVAATCSVPGGTGSASAWTSDAPWE